MPFFEGHFFTQMTVLHSARSSDKCHDICDMETIPPETDVLIKNAHFPSFLAPKFPFRRSQIANEVDNTRPRLGKSRAALQRTPTIKLTISNRRGLAGSNCSIIKGQLEHLANWAQQLMFHFSHSTPGSRKSSIACQIYSDMLHLVDVYSSFKKAFDNGFLCIM